ncbi:MAG TPA: PD-(D/E)XK nuclease family protein [Fimbriimonadaceae bacterium]|jgi:hypothetical protein
MGSSRYFNWSHSRQELYERCPRAMFYEYYPWGETAPHEDILALFKRSTSVPLLTGTIVHDFISIALRNFKTTGGEIEDLIPAALRRYNQIVKRSLDVATLVRKGLKPHGNAVMFMHHYEDGHPREELEEFGRTLIRDSLAQFQTSATWKAIKKTEPRRWESINTTSDQQPYFEATAAMGFKAAVGVRIYTAFDLAVRDDDDNIIIIDWKTGMRTIKSLATARRQLSAYALWAISKGRPLSKVKVHVAFLKPGQRWSPKSVSEDQIQEALARIDTQVGREKSVILEEKDETRKKAYFANAKEFPARPGLRVCGNCKYRHVCSAGKTII